MKIMSNDKFEVLQYDNGDCFIKDLLNNKYFFRENYFANSKYKFDNEKEIKWNYKDILLLIVLIFAILSLIFIFYNNNMIYNYKKYNAKMYILTAIFLFINIAFHELSHIGVLHIFQRKVGQIKFKLNFIFPAIAVNTSDSYMLPRFRRFFVYVAGIETNIIISMLILLLFPESAYLLRPVIWAVVANLIPIGVIKSDGYHIFFNSIMNVKDLKKNRSIWALLGKWIFIILSMYFIIESLFKSFGVII